MPQAQCQANAEVDEYAKCSGIFGQPYQLPQLHVEPLLTCRFCIRSTSKKDPESLRKIIVEMSRHNVHATQATLFKELQDLYWNAAFREVCNMILFFNEACQAPESTSAPLTAFKELEAQNFKKMFKLWSTIVTLEKQNVY